ncbi:MAG: LD-carboxypeptidase [Bacteroidota bacterium]
MPRPPSRRRFLRGAALSASAFALSTSGLARPVPEANRVAPVRPRRLRPGDTVALVAPAGVVRERDVEESREALEALGLRTVIGEHALERDGYLAGRDGDRATDLVAAFTDDTITGIVAIRGGWGCARLLPYLDWPTLRANPKVLLGYSDLTSLLLALYARTGLVGFHGPVATSTFTDFTLTSLRDTLFGASGFEMLPDADEGPIDVITPGTATGPLVGGNLTVLCAMVGTPYLPSFEGHILFLEDIGESVYRVDRMLTQLGQAGLLGGLAGIVMGSCRGCTPERDAIATFELDEVLRHHFGPLGVPTVMGAPIGHIRDKWTVPIGATARLDAEAGTLTFEEPPTVA